MDCLVLTVDLGVGSTALLHFLGSMRSAVNERKERNKVSPL